MEKFTILKSVAAPFPDTDINTDIIYPAQFLKTTQKSGLGTYAFHSLRYDTNGAENPDFLLNRAPYRQAGIIVAGKNFACGSSREHAVWSLMDFGIRCVIAESFGDIFYNNSQKNGLLLIRLDNEAVQKLLACVGSDDPVFTIDLPQQTIHSAGSGDITFEIDPALKHRLLEGLDDIGMTLQYADDITAFETAQKAKQPWLY